MVKEPSNGLPSIKVSEARLLGPQAE